MGWKKLLLILILSLILSLFLYGNAIKGEFIYDDQYFTSRADLRKVESLAHVWFEPLTPNARINGNYRPLTVFTLALNYILFGESPISFHLVNILLNGIVIFMVFYISWRLFKNNILSIFITLFFAFLPIHTESVSFIKSRDEILWALFALTSWLFFLKGTENNKIKYRLIFLSAVLTFFAILGKDFAISSPLIFLWCYLISKRIEYKKILKLAVMYLPFILVYLLLRWQILGPFAFGKELGSFVNNPLINEPYLTRFITAFKIFFTYMFKTFVPINLSATYYYNHLSVVKTPFSREVIFGMGFMILFLYLSLGKRFRITPLGIGASLFIISYLIFSKFIFAAGDILSEHWMYLPSLGLSFIAGYLFYLLYQFNKVVTVILFILILSFYGYLVLDRNQIWVSNEAFAKALIRDAPDSVQAHLNMGEWLFYNQEVDGAKKEALKADDIYHNYPQTLNLLGRISLVQKDYNNASNLFLKASRLYPGWLLNYFHLAFSLAKEGKYQESFRIADMIKGRYINDTQFRFLMAVLLYKLNDPEEAMKYFDSSISDVDNIKAIKNFTGE